MHDGVIAAEPVGRMSVFTLAGDLDLASAASLRAQLVRLSGAVYLVPHSRHDSGA